MGTPNAEGRSARLRDGECRFWLEGPAAGPTVLLIHGATVPAWEFDRLVPHLHAAGLATLRLDLFGHGASDRPAQEHDYPLFRRQVCDLLDAVGVEGPVHVVGHSLGAALAAGLAALEPARFARVVLAAPLVDFARDRMGLRLVRAPVLGEVLMPTFVLPMLVRRRTRRYRSIEEGRFVGLFKEQLRIRGFGRALLSLMRSGALGDQTAQYAALAETGHPVLLLSAELDNIVSRQQLSALEHLVPRARHRQIENAPHAFFLTHPEPVAAAIAAFFGCAGPPRA